MQIKSHDAYVNRAMLRAREALVGMRVRLENEIRGLPKTYGIMFGRQVGGSVMKSVYLAWSMRVSDTVTH
ncbi:hypothetical protein [Pararhodobacter oceanensis]|uniref:hypothetical protein n=1 Tax=Pararhodobacter oceanensis TaxID=2172121 RepID=UPI00197CF4A3|nr:hypothetical protein [Pararhodobacter oceanensis]